MAYNMANQLLPVSIAAEHHQTMIRAEVKYQLSTIKALLQMDGRVTHKSPEILKKAALELWCHRTELWYSQINITRPGEIDIPIQDRRSVTELLKWMAKVILYIQTQQGVIFADLDTLKLSVLREQLEILRSFTKNWEGEYEIHSRSWNTLFGNDFLTFDAGSPGPSQSQNLVQQHEEQGRDEQQQKEGEAQTEERDKARWEPVGRLWPGRPAEPHPRQFADPPFKVVSPRDLEP